MTSKKTFQFGQKYTKENLSQQLEEQSKSANPQLIKLHGVLKNLDLSGMYLQGIDFSGCILTRAKFTSANLTGTTFTEATFKDVNLEGAIFTLH